MPHKILLIGAKGYSSQSQEVEIRCFHWKQLSNIQSISDYDIVILDLLSLPPVEKVDWEKFYRLFARSAVDDVVGPGGVVFVIGDPTFDVPEMRTALPMGGGQPTDDTEKSVAESSPEPMPLPTQTVHVPFLQWTFAKFQWDAQQGTTSFLNDDIRPAKNYLKNLSRWEYSLTKCDADFIGFNASKFAERSNHKLKVRLHKIDYCTNRTGRALAFAIKMQVYEADRYGVSTEKGSSGHIVFLPKIDLPEDDTLRLVLRDFCGVETGKPEPAWVLPMKAPGQNEIDAEIQSIQAEIEAIQQKLTNANLKRERARRCLKLLYERGAPLESIVRETFRSLGATVDEPSESDKEDGWLIVKVGDETFYGVLEVKSTRNDHFDRDGLRQLNEWKFNGRTLHRRDYKGIFVGINAVEKHISERPDGFHEGWRNEITLHKDVCIGAEVLFFLFILEARGRLDKEQFWKDFFATDGVFDGEPFLNDLALDEREFPNDDTDVDELDE